MGNVFTHEMKPLEVEILVAEVGADPGDDQIFHILYDGTVVDEDRFTALGGEAEAITGRLARAYRADWPLAEALTASVSALQGPERQLSPHELEVAVLDRGNGRRAFRRVLEAEVTELLSGERPRRGVARTPPTSRSGRAWRRACIDETVSRDRRPGALMGGEAALVLSAPPAATGRGRYCPMKWATTGAPATRRRPPRRRRASTASPSAGPRDGRGRRG